MKIRHLTFFSIYILPFKFAYIDDRPFQMDALITGNEDEAYSPSGIFTGKQFDLPSYTSFSQSMSYNPVSSMKATFDDMERHDGVHVDEDVDDALKKVSSVDGGDCISLDATMDDEGRDGEVVYDDNVNKLKDGTDQGDSNHNKSDSSAPNVNKTPFLLSTPLDSLVLNELHCMVRENIEVFTATRADADQPQPGRKVPVVPGQIGIRCIHCKVLPSLQRAKRAVCYPNSVAGIFHSVSNMKTDHFANCPYIPTDIKEKFLQLKTSCGRRNIRGTGYTSTAHYYCESAKKLGVHDSPEGIRIGELPGGLLTLASASSIVLNSSADKEPLLLPAPLPRSQPVTRSNPPASTSVPPRQEFQSHSFQANEQQPILPSHLTPMGTFGNNFPTISNANSRTNNSMNYFDYNQLGPPPASLIPARQQSRYPRSVPAMVHIDWSSVNENDKTDHT